MAVETAVTGCDNAAARWLWILSSISDFWEALAVRHRACAQQRRALLPARPGARGGRWDLSDFENSENLLMGIFTLRMPLLQDCQDLRHPPNAPAVSA